MSEYWETLASRSNAQFTSDDFESAAYRLVVEQVLYHSDRHSRTAYWVVQQYERDFRQALAPLGINVQVNRQLRYAYAIPRHAKAGTSSTSLTIMALVFRAIYDESASMGQLTADGEVICDLVELDEKYRLMSGREFPTKGKLDSLMETLKRWGIARTSSGNDLDEGDITLGQPYVVIIRPAITDVLGEAALTRLIQFRTAATETYETGSIEEDCELEGDSI